MATPVQMPKQGNTVEECLLVEWKVNEGDAVAAGDILCAIETDKASFEVEAPAAGTLLKRFAAEGDLVPVLTHVCVIGEAGEDVDAFAPDVAAGPAASPSPAPAGEAPTLAPVSSPPPSSQPVAAPPGSAAESAPDSSVAVFRVSPRARHASERLGVDLTHIAGSGPQGRITSRDVEASAPTLTPLAQRKASTGLVPGGATGLGGRVRGQDLVMPSETPAPVAVTPVEPAVVPYRGIRKLIGERMHASLRQHAQLTLSASADAGALLAYRQQVKQAADALDLPNITLGDMIAYAAIRTLKRFPELNAVLDAENERILQYPYVNFAIAVDTDRGLMVPVIEHADALSLADLSRAILDAAALCRGGGIDPDRLAGGTFTLTNLGNLGIESFTPVLNAPQAAILGVCAIRQVPVPAEERGFRFVPRMGLSLTIDHRTVDGAPAARYLQALSEALGRFDLLLAQ